MNKPPDEVAALGKRYGLEIGTRDNPKDAYNERGKWCLTKTGQRKIALKCGITFDNVTMQCNDHFVVAMAEFTMGDPPEDHVGPTKLIEVGSCRHDTGKKNPQTTHAPEMAFKRMRVRGVIELAAAGVFYGEEEFDDDFFKSNRPSERAQPAAQPKPAPTASGPTLTGEQIEKRSKMMESWDNICAKVCELTGLERAAFEVPLWRHCGMFQNTADSRWVPVPKDTMEDLFVVAKTPDGYGKWCGSLYGKAKTVVERLEGGFDVDLWDLDPVAPNPEPATVLVLSPNGDAGSAPASTGESDLPV